jgi:uncharacterized protein (TIGR02996 family)
MSTQQALLDAIWAEPLNDGVRLVYADWLEEHGPTDADRARAELIRVQCELDGLRGDDPRYDTLEERADALIAQWGKTWWAQLPEDCQERTFRRGFPVPYFGQGRLGLHSLRALNEAHFRAAPSWTYGCVMGTDLKVLLPWALLHRLEKIDLRPPLPVGWAQSLAACANLRHVTCLQLNDCPVNSADVNVLLDAWTSRRLETLQAKFDANSVAALAAHPTAAGLKCVYIFDAQLSATSVRHLTLGAHLTGVVSLWLSYNPLGDAGLSSLLRWPHLNRLRGLFIERCELTDAGVEELAASSAVANLRQLALGYDRIGDAGARALANSPFLANLRELRLIKNQIGEEGALALASSPYLSNIKELSIFGNPLRGSPAAMNAIRDRFGKTIHF